MKRAGEKQLQYEIPVDLDQCTEEERRHWLIKRANIRNGGRPRSNPLYDGKQIDPEMCKDANGDWTKFIKARCNEEELAKFEELNRLCDNHIITDHLSEEHRLRFLYGCKHVVQDAFNTLIQAETIRYDLRVEDLTG